MPEYHVLRETPEGSGTFVATGETVAGEPTAEQAMWRAMALSAEGPRHAIWPFQALRGVPPEPAPAPEPPAPMQDAAPELPAPEPPAAEDDTAASLDTDTEAHADEPAPSA